MPWNMVPSDGSKPKPYLKRGESPNLLEAGLVCPLPARAHGRHHHVRQRGALRHLPQAAWDCCSDYRINQKYLHTKLRYM